MHGSGLKWHGLLSVCRREHGLPAVQCTGRPRWLGAAVRFVLRWLALSVTSAANATDAIEAFDAAIDTVGVPIAARSPT
jgi:hypothetical protein